MRDLVRFVQRELKASANPVKAKPMAAYMKTNMPFYGVQKPRRAQICRAIVNDFPITTRRDYRAAVETLWALPHREEKYLAIQLAQSYPEHITPSSVPMYERMIRNGAWWDFVDELASRLVGQVLLEHRSTLESRIDRWIDDRDFWIRRSAIICQLRHKAKTDERRLFRYCRARAHETEFFIRKGIGWALREYAKTSPKSVRRFLLKHRDAWSTLTFREAGKYLAISD